MDMHMFKFRTQMKSLVSTTLTEWSFLLSSNSPVCLKVVVFSSNSNIVKLSSCSSLLKFLNSTLKVSIQIQKEQS